MGCCFKSVGRYHDLDLNLTLFFSTLASDELVIEAEEKGELSSPSGGFLKSQDAEFIFEYTNVFCSSELLLLHLRYPAAAVSGHMSSDWLHHGLEDEGVFRRRHPCWHRAQVTTYEPKADQLCIEPADP